MLMRLQESILHCVASFLRTAEDSEEGWIDAPALSSDENLKGIRVAAPDFCNGIGIGVKRNLPLGGTVVRVEKIRDFRWIPRQGDPGLEIGNGAGPELHCIQELGEPGNGNGLDDL